VQPHSRPAPHVASSDLTKHCYLAYRKVIGADVTVAAPSDQPGRLSLDRIGYERFCWRVLGHAELAPSNAFCRTATGSCRLEKLGRTPDLLVSFFFQGQRIHIGLHIGRNALAFQALAI
jgi:hypothetical protein